MTGKEIRLGGKHQTELRQIGARLVLTGSRHQIGLMDQIQSASLAFDCPVLEMCAPIRSMYHHSVLELPPLQ